MNKPLPPAARCTRASLSAALVATLLGGCSLLSPKPPDATLGEAELRTVVEELAALDPPRNFEHVESLDRAAANIHQRFRAHGYTPTYQDYDIECRVYRNVVAGIGPIDAPRIVVGAHYDVFADTPGADDNASGVAGLLAVARLLQPHAADLTKRVEFVAYTLEEPPHFKTEFMGSFVHARDLADAGVTVEAMISLEMLGFYSDAPDSQRYPLDLLKFVYPSRGDFIGVVSNFDSFRLRGRFKSAMRRADIPVESLAAPESLIVIAFSDHLNYWRYGWPAIMVTDTAFMRNKHYHRATDTPDTLDYARMKEAVRGVFFGVYDLATR